MKYCIEFTKDFNYIDEIDELLIRVTPDTKQDPLSFMAAYPDKRVIIAVENEVSKYLIKNLEKIREERPEFNFTLCLPPTFHSLAQELKEKNIPFFFNTLVNNWDTLQSYVTIGVTDMYITETLGFELDKVANVLHSNNILIRAYPNVAQSSMSSSTNDIPALKTFFIRPEDIDIYAQYIDVFEFWASKNQLNTYYEVYNISKQWYGPLKEIIIGFNSDLDSRFVLPPFAARRIKCGKRCFKGLGCKICDRIEEASKTLEENGLIVKK